MALSAKRTGEKYAADVFVFFPNGKVIPTSLEPYVHTRYLPIDGFEFSGCANPHAVASNMRGDNFALNFIKSIDKVGVACMHLQCVHRM